MRAQCLSLGVLLAGVGCTSMRVVQPMQVIPSQHPASVYVYTLDGDATVVRWPQIDGDTLRGEDARGESFAAALQDIVKVKAPEKDRLKTLLLAGGGVVVGTFFIYELVASGSASACDPSNQTQEAEALTPCP